MEKEVLFFIMQVVILLYWSCKHHRNCADANHKFLDDCTGQILTWSDMWNVPYAGSCYDEVALSIFIETFAWLVFQYGQNRWHRDLFCYRSCFGCIKSSSLLAHNFHNSWHNRDCSNHHGILLHSSRTGRFDIKKLKLRSWKNCQIILSRIICSNRHQVVPNRTWASEKQKHQNWQKLRSLCSK